MTTPPAQASKAIPRKPNKTIPTWYNLLLNFTSTEPYYIKTRMLGVREQNNKIRGRPPYGKIYLLEEVTHLIRERFCFH